MDDVRKFNNLIIVIIAATFDGCRLDFMSKGEGQQRHMVRSVYVCIYKSLDLAD